MKTRSQRLVSIFLIAIFGSIAIFAISERANPEEAIRVLEFARPTPEPPAAPFDQKAAIAKLREQIKGRENDPADKVFKNIQMLKTFPAGRLLAVMEFGYARSLGVDCTHCHVPDKWESEEKAQKQIAREMWGMMGKINSDLLKNIKNLKSAAPTVNCTTCHRGEVTPALNLAVPPKA